MNLKKRIQNDGEYTINPDNILSERVRESKDHHTIWGGIKEIDFIKIIFKITLILERQCIPIMEIH